MFPDPIEPGIYFGLDEEVYHRARWLGSTDIKKLYASPPDWWYEGPENPLQPPPEETSPAKEFGTAVHYCTLYGRERFDAVYRSVADTGKLEVSAEGLKNWILEQGGKPRKLKDGNLQLVKEMGVRLLPEGRYQRAVQAAAMIRQNPHLLPMFEGEGWSEVSVFWIDSDGVPCKGRFDRLKPRAVVDIKSFSARGRIVPLDRMILSDILRFRYDIQAAHYLEGRMAARTLAAEGRIFGDVRADQPGLIKLLFFEEPGFVFVFYKSDGAPIAKSFQMLWNSAPHQAGKAGRTQAIANYLMFRERFGTGFWVCTDEPYNLDADDLPAWL
ncbi:MAG: PD-(D/E)XK nuclease-like domain-containing protein [Anaerolineales bacterium]